MLHVPWVTKHSRYIDKWKNKAGMMIPYLVGVHPSDYMTWHQRTTVAMIHEITHSSMDPEGEVTIITPM